jgi:nucleotide-binding universal stress UspA family protein
VANISIEQQRSFMTAALPDWKGAIQSEESRIAAAIENIVLPLDGSLQAGVAFPVAKQLSLLYRATLRVGYAGKEQFDATNAASQLGLKTDEARGVVLESARFGATGDELSQRLHELPRALLVISTALGPPARPNRFGTLTEAVLATRPAYSVLVNPEHCQESWNMRHILLAHDGTPVSEPAVAPAADLAQRAGAEVIALHVAARGEERPEARGSIAAPLYVDQPQHEWPAWAEEFMNRIVATGAVDSGVHFKLRVAGGQAGSELAHVARQRQIDLVVMAWHGHWAEHDDCATRVVVRNAGCPVMLVYSGS